MIRTVRESPAGGCGRNATLAFCIAMLCIGACHQAAVDTAATPKEAGSEPEKEGVTLSVEQIAKAGIATTLAKSIDYRDEVAGYAVIIAHDSVAAAVAELSTAQAAQQLSRATAARVQRLAGTAGAMSGDATGSAVRQVATDAAAVTLAQQRLSSIIGAGLPAELKDPVALEHLASGQTKLLRATFPLGTLRGTTPVALRVAHLDGVTPDAPQPAQEWNVRPVWAAPADTTVPGRSFFALLKAGDAGEGERLLVWAPGTDPSQQGVLVPASALIISGGKYWCYVEGQAGVYSRREIATDRPSGTGYFVTQSIAAGDKIVTAGASLLLARETNASSDAD